jgi:hypothetical protein
MSGRRPWLAPGLALLLVLAAAGWIFQARLGNGDLYPVYSSLRADALGTRALFEALQQVPGLRVDRDFRPLARLGAQRRLVVVPGLAWRKWQEVPANQLAAIDAAVRRGARVVLAFYPDLKSDERDARGQQPEDVDRTGHEGGKGQDAKTAPEKKARRPQRPGEEAWRLKEVAKVWGVTFKHRWLMAKQPGAERDDTAPAELPAHVAWQSDLHFGVAADSGWQVLYRRAGEPVLVEKAVGSGSLVLLADAYCLSNEAMNRERATALVTYLVGAHRQVTFAEGPLGVLEDNGLGSLARRYGLGGALALSALLGGLYAWRRLVPFLPPQEGETAEGAVALTDEPLAGFTGLLRRSLGPADVLGTCVEEWRKSRRSGGGSRTAGDRLEAAWSARDPQAPVAQTYNALARALKLR